VLVPYQFQGFLIGLSRSSAGPAECKRRNDFQVGFIDPSRVNTVTVHDKPKETEDILLEFLLVQEYRTKILFLYNFK
jgi:hypothetical protein